MRKFGLIFFSFIIILLFSGCGNQTPKKQVDNELKAIKTRNIEDISDFNSIFSNEALSKKHEKSYKEAISKLQDFDYEIISEEQDGSKGEVRVKIKTYNFGDAYKRTYDNIIAEVKSGKITDKTKDLDIESRVYELLFQNMSKIKEKNFEKEITIYCKKNKKEEWETNIGDSLELQDAILGGLVSAINNKSK